MLRKMSVVGKGLAVAIVFSCAVPMSAHHGSGISYDMEHLWKTKATVVEFKYANPHPWMVFDRTNDKGEVEHWTAELVTNPTFLLRAGWTKSRTEAALKPGTVVNLTLGTSKVGGFNGCIRDVLSQTGEALLDTGRGNQGDSTVPSGRGNN